MSSQNNRDFFRLQLKVPLLAEMRVVGIKKKQVETKPTRILIVDISAGGMRIRSKLNIPLNVMLLEFSFRVMDKNYKILGTMIRKTELEESDLFEYGIIFSIDENDRNELLAHLQALSVRLRQTNVISTCSFATEIEMKEFYG